MSAEWLSRLSSLPSQARKLLGGEQVHKPRIVIAGHSHAESLMRGHQRDSEEASLVQIDDGVEAYALVGKLPRGADYTQAMCEQAAQSVSVVVWSGNDHNAWFLFKPDQPFDFWRDDVPQIDESATILPAALVQHLFYATTNAESLKAILPELVAQPGARVIVLETPPPKGDEAELRLLLNREYAHVAAARGVAIEDMPLTDRWLRLKLWRTHCEAFARIAAEGGAEYMKLPAWAFDAEGFLAREHWAKDATHGNMAYGDRLRRHLVDTLLSPA